MRIIGGELGGRRLVTPSGPSTRPSAARVREGLASALDARGCLREANVLDLFAGSGALGFEALSRGARHVVCVDANPRAIRCIADNARALGVSDRVRAIRLDLQGAAAKVASRLTDAGAPFSLAFVDAPYAQVDSVPPLLERLVADTVLGRGALVAVEQAAKANLAWPEVLRLLATYRYGDTGVSLLQVASRGRT